jgi:hypothetical protein
MAQLNSVNGELLFFIYPDVFSQSAGAKIRLVAALVLPSFVSGMEPACWVLFSICGWQCPWVFQGFHNPEALGMMQFPETAAEWFLSGDIFQGRVVT